MGLKSVHSQEYDFQESGEVDRFLKMGTHFQERSGSLENGLFGVLGSRYCHVLKEVWYIYDWDTGWLVLM